MSACVCRRDLVKSCALLCVRVTEGERDDDERAYIVFLLLCYIIVVERRVHVRRWRLSRGRVPPDDDLVVFYARACACVCVWERESIPLYTTVYTARYRPAGAFRENDGGGGGAPRMIDRRQRCRDSAYCTYLYIIHIIYYIHTIERVGTRERVCSRRL